MQERGRIIAVQEQRFWLQTDGGQVLLLTLAHNAPQEADDLCRLQEQNAPVIVDVEGKPNHKGGVARALRTAR